MESGQFNVVSIDTKFLMQNEEFVFAWEKPLYDRGQRKLIPHDAKYYTKINIYFNFYYNYYNLTTAQKVAYALNQTFNGLLTASTTAENSNQVFVYHSQSLLKIPKDSKPRKQDLPQHYFNGVDEVKAVCRGLGIQLHFISTVSASELLEAEQFETMYNRFKLQLLNYQQGSILDKLHYHLGLNGHSVFKQGGGLKIHAARSSNKSELHSEIQLSLRFAREFNVKLQWMNVGTLGRT